MIKISTKAVFFMPVIARFYGMVLKMYLLGKEHNPRIFM